MNISLQVYPSTRLLVKASRSLETEPESGGSKALAFWVNLAISGRIPFV